MMCHVDEKEASFSNCRFKKTRDIYGDHPDLFNYSNSAVSENFSLDLISKLKSVNEKLQEMLAAQERHQNFL